MKWKSIALGAALSLAASLPASARQTTPLTALQILQRAVEAEDRNESALEDYAWHERDMVWNIDKKTGIRKISSDKTYDVSQVDGVEYQRLIGRNGKPLTPAEKAEADRRFARFLAKHARDSTAQKAKEAQKKAKDKAQQRERNEEVPFAFRFTLAGERRTPLCDCYVISGVPLPSYHPRDKNLRLLQHLAGTVWVDTKTYSVAKLDITILKPISFGWVFARIGRGGRLVAEEAPVDGHWFAKSLTANLTARLLLVKGFDVAIESDYSDYREFHVSTQIVPASR